jgi:hypothetical protein
MYKISFGVNGVARCEYYKAESEAEAVESWEWFWEQYDADVDFVSCVEVSE